MLPGNVICQRVQGGARRLILPRNCAHLIRSVAGDFKMHNSTRKADIAVTKAGREEDANVERKKMVSNCTSVC